MLTLQSLLHNLTWKFKNATGYLRVFSSIADIRAYRKCASGRGMAPGEQAFLSIRELDGRKISCRAGTTDPIVLWDVFYWKFHIPPCNIRSSKTVVDLGANVGYTAVHWCVLCPDAQVIAVEMDPENAMAAEKNTQNWEHRCKIVNAAIWSKDGYISYDGHESWGLAVSNSGSKGARAITLDTLFNEHQLTHVDLVKMDIEGAEQNIFESDLTWLKRVKQLIVEFHQPVDPDWLQERLLSAGFQSTRENLPENVIWAWSGGS